MSHPIPEKIKNFVFKKEKRPLLDFLQALGTPLYNKLSTFFDFFILFGRVLARLPFKKNWRKKEILHFMVTQCISSIPIIVLSTAFAGIVVTHQIAWHMNISLHDVSMIPGFSGQFILRELGVAIPSMMLVSRAGAATTAEIGSMKVTDQVDALKLLGIDTVNYLVLPRFIAAFISSACLTLIAITVTLACTIVVSVTQYPFSILEFLNAFRHFVGLEDIFCALVKGVVFGSIIPIISCSYGFRCQGGAEGVGTATTNSVVASTIAIIIFDFLLTSLFTLIL